MISASYKPTKWHEGASETMLPSGAKPYSIAWLDLAITNLPTKANLLNMCIANLIPSQVSVCHCDCAYTDANLLTTGIGKPYFIVDLHILLPLYLPVQMY